MTDSARATAATTTLTDRACNALAAFITETRPDWQAPGVVAALRADRDRFDPWQLAVAMIRRAADPANLTPRLQGFDRDGVVGCRRHPGASVRTDGRCGACWSEANEDGSGRVVDRGGQPIPVEARLSMLAVLDRVRPQPEETADA